MTDKFTTETDNEIHSLGLSRFDDIYDKSFEERKMAIRDRRFTSIAGAQWEGAIGDLYKNKIKIEVNKVGLAVTRIYNEWLNNRITVDFITKDGSTNDDLADVLDGLYRADEDASFAREAYDNCFNEGIGGGIGGFRYSTEYECPNDPDDEKQRIVIEPIFDADQSVYFDPGSKRQDKSDANFAFLIQSFTKEGFEQKWPEADTTSWTSDSESGAFDWAPDETVRVAEYYVVTETVQNITIFKRFDGSKISYTDEEFAKLGQSLKQLGLKKHKTKDVKVRKIIKYTMSSTEILDVQEIAGPNIPIVIFFAKRWFIDNIERSTGHVRPAIDAQQLENMTYSQLAEISALSAREKPIFSPEQISGHGENWAADNVENFTYMLLNPIVDAAGNSIPSGPIAYTKPPSVPPAMAAILQLSGANISEILGKQESGEELRANTSGKAVELVQNRLDQQSFVYMSNMAKTIQRGGEIWLGMAKEIYVEDDRSMKSIGRHGDVNTVKLGEKVVDSDGNTVSKGDISRADFDVKASVGLSSESKRMATVRAMTGMMQITSDPETIQVLGAIALMNMEGEGLNDTREFYRKKLVGLGVLQPSASDIASAKENAEPPQPSPDEAFLAAEAEKSIAQAKKADADTDKSIADTRKSEAQTIEILAGVERDNLAISAVKELSQSAHNKVFRPT